MTDKSIETEKEFSKPLNEMLKSMIKERLETLMEKEREAFLVNYSCQVSTFCGKLLPKFSTPPTPVNFCLI
ncbi:MAG: hypothetical protein V5A79_06850 [Candidatus Bipolaricaulota bacterium]